MAIKFTAQGSMTQVTMPAALQTLGIDTASLSSSVVSNDDSSEGFLYVNVLFKLGTQALARVSPFQVSLVIVPSLASIVGDTSDQDLAGSYIPKDKDGTAVTWLLDAAVTARNLTWANVCLPNSDFYYGILNTTGRVFAGTNELWVSSPFTVENRT